MDYHAATVRFGKPGKLMVAPIGTTEPTTVTAAWPAGWVCPGFTDEGSTFNYNQPREKVYVAEQRPPVGSAPGDTEIGVEFALAETTFRNLRMVLNQGLVEGPDDTGEVGDGNAWALEAPMGDEDDVHLMLGWDASSTVGTNDLRFIWRKCLNVAQLSFSNRKGATKVTFPSNYEVYLPDTGLPPFKILGAGKYNPVP